MPAAPGRPHTDAVVAALEATGLAVGRGEEPAGAGWEDEPSDSPFKPYAVLYPTPGVPDGDLADPNEYIDYSCQATCVAATQEGAEAVADIVKTLVGQRLAVTGRYAYPVTLILDRPASRDDTTQPVVHYAIVQLRFRTGPA